MYAGWQEKRLDVAEQRAEWRSGMHAGRSYGALIPLLDNNSRIHLIPWEMPLFIQFICRL